MIKILTVFPDNDAKFDNVVVGKIMALDVWRLTLWMVGWNPLAIGSVEQ